jgi:hypothetical protein
MASLLHDRTDLLPHAYRYSMTQQEKKKLSTLIAANGRNAQALQGSEVNVFTVLKSST